MLAKRADSSADAAANLIRNVDTVSCHSSKPWRPMQVAFPGGAVGDGRSKSTNYALCFSFQRSEIGLTYTGDLPDRQRGAL